MSDLDHSQLPDVSQASLPETYTNAKTALAECTKVDECQSWGDKAEAMASYARQAEDEQLRKMADRIQARAIRRCGELLKQVEPASGERTDLEPKDGTVPRSTRESVATEAGLSERQRKTALRTANVPDDEFEQAVESEKPPTVTKLADQGKKKRNIVDLGDRDPNTFNKAIHFVGMIERHKKELAQYNIEEIASTLNEDERDRVKKAIDAIDSINDQLATRI